MRFLLDPGVSNDDPPFLTLRGLLAMVLIRGATVVDVGFAGDCPFFLPIVCRSFSITDWGRILLSSISNAPFAKDFSLW